MQVTAEEYAALAPGARYQHPQDPPGKFRHKRCGSYALVPLAHHTSTVQTAKDDMAYVEL
jgi:hypothetical protein